MSQTIYTNLTKRIIKALQEGLAPWRKPWVHQNLLPVNAASKRPYKGINVLSLWIAQEIYGYSSHLWGTANMWKQLGGSVLKGQTPWQVCLFRPVKDKKTRKMKTILNTFDVFNLDQVWGCLTLRRQVKRVITDEAQINFAPAEQIAEDMNVPTIHRGNTASYNSNLDRITLPPKVRFLSRAGYWSTRFHELIHSTGHPSRLGRTFGRFGDGDYAFEELIAEIGTAFVCAMVGIPEAQDQLPHHANYIGHWLAVLQEDEKAIFRAAGAAQKAAHFVLTASAKK
jgi:antirestriction protein ArdC